MSSQTCSIRPLVSHFLEHVGLVSIWDTEFAGKRRAIISAPRERETELGEQTSQGRVGCAGPGIARILLGSPVATTGDECCSELKTPGRGRACSQGRVHTNMLRG